MYAECFRDQLAFAATLFEQRAESSSASALPAATLGDPARLAPLLSVFGRKAQASEPRAIASQWSKYAFARLIIPTVVLQCCLDRAVDFAAADWQIVVADDGTPGVFIFDANPLSTAGTGGDFGSLIDDALSPLIAALSGGPGLAPRIYASNAAMYYDWALSQLADQPHVRAAPMAAAHALNEMPNRSDGGFNPFHASHRKLAPGTVDAAGAPADTCRRLCCVRDLDSIWGLCSNCPRAMRSPERRRRAASG